ncbi:MAG: SDR family NAD(P)-dependent oxidoreductase [Bacteroidales bacterium]|jgi:short-subunit dehydrogenase
MNLKQKYGNTAMVAGASEGIGAAFATRLAAEGMDLILIARRLKPLQQLADLLESKYQVNAMCISIDLSGIDAIQQIEKALNGREISLLVYNAALSYIGPFIKNSAENHSQAAQLNMITPLKMVQSYGEKMLIKGKGAVVLMTSLAGFQGSGYLSVYAATKAFIRILAESLWYEWRNSGVDVIACCAGATATPGYKNTHPEKTGFLTPRVLEPEEVADECFKKLGKQPSFIAGRGNRLASFVMQKIFPRKMAVTIMGDTTRKMYML